MANLTDPLIRAVQGTDPQNLMEYITRQKIYDSRFWKEECFGLSVADVLEKAAKSLSCIGGTFGPNQQPTKFLCLTLKLLQLQPESELIIEEFLQQDHFKYVKALGAFYLRLTGRPADIFQALEPMYSDFSKIKVRRPTEWELAYMDTLVHDLLTEAYFVGMALPRLPMRETLEQEGYLEEGPRSSALQGMIMEKGGLEEFLEYKAKIERMPEAIELWNKRNKESLKQEIKGHSKSKSNTDIGTDSSSMQGEGSPSIGHTRKRPLPISQGNDNENDGEEEGELPQGMTGAYIQARSEVVDRDRRERKDKEKKAKKKKGYGTLFKKDKSDDSRNEGTDKKKKRRRRDDTDTLDVDERRANPTAPPEEGSEEYWNEQRAKLGLKPLRK